MLTASVFNVMRFATHDGPGIRTTIFFKGCPLSCWWCHNPESQSYQPDRLFFAERCRRCLECVGACPQHAIEFTRGAIATSEDCTRCGACAEICMSEARQIAGKRYTLAELIAEIEKDVVFFDDSGGGVTLSGGEPLGQPRFVSAFLRECRLRGIHTVLETCGFGQPDAFLEIALLANEILFDLKLPDAEKHCRYTGVPNNPILRNLESLVARRHPVTVRIPVVPGVNDSDDDATEFAACLVRLRAQRVELLPYHSIGTEKYRRLGREYKLNGTPPPAAAGLAGFRDVLTRAGLHVTVGG